MCQQQGCPVKTFFTGTACGAADGADCHDAGGCFFDRWCACQDRGKVPVVATATAFTFFQKNATSGGSSVVFTY
jgi:hypothetical protein